jgi:hypothetical protein
MVMDYGGDISHHSQKHFLSTPPSSLSHTLSLSRTHTDTLKMLLKTCNVFAQDAVPDADQSQEELMETISKGMLSRP